MKRKVKPRKTRNPFAVDAQFKTKAGPHKDRKKEQDKQRCRKPKKNAED